MHSLSRRLLAHVTSSDWKPVLKQRSAKPAVRCITLLASSHRSILGLEHSLELISLNACWWVCSQHHSESLSKSRLGAADLARTSPNSLPTPTAVAQLLHHLAPAFSQYLHNLFMILTESFSSVQCKELASFSTSNYPSLYEGKRARSKNAFRFMYWSDCCVVLCLRNLRSKSPLVRSMCLSVESSTGGV